MMALVRTSPQDQKARHAGLSQMIIDPRRRRRHGAADHQPRRRATISTRSSCEDVFVPDADLLGKVGEGWKQCTSELALERSGPERVLSTLPLLVEWVEACEPARSVADAHTRQVLGGLVARMFVLRQMSLAVAAELASGASPDVEAALVKELGTHFEGELVDAIRRRHAVGAALGRDVAL